MKVQLGNGLLVVCDSYLSEKTWRKMGKMPERNKVTAFAIQACTSFVVGRMIGWRGVAPRGTIQGYFWNFVPNG